MENQANCEELIKKLAEAEKTIEALRNQEVDAIADKKNILLHQLKETQDELIKQHNNLDRIYQERFKLLADLNARKEELERYTEELRQIRQEAQEARDRYADLYDYAPAGYLTLDNDGIILEANLTAARLLGLERKELVRSRLTDFVIEESLDTLNTCVSQASITGPSQKCELRMQKKDGSKFFGLLESMVKEASGGNPEHIRTIITDITDRKLLEIKQSRYINDLIALSQSATAMVELVPEGNVYQEIARQVQQLVDGLCLIIVNSFDENTQLFQVRSLSGTGLEVKAFTESLGQNPIGLAVPISPQGRIALTSGRLQKVPHGILDLADGIISESTASQIKERLNIGSVYAMGFFWQEKLYGSLNILMGGENEPQNPSIIETFIYQATIALQRRQAEEALRQSEQRLRRIYDSGMLGIIYWNIDGEITGANDKFLEIVGYSREDLDSSRIDWVNMTPPEYRELDQRLMEEIKATGVSRKPFEKEYFRKDGTRIPIIISEAMLDETGLNGVAFVMDITERKQAEKALQESEEKFRTLFSSMNEGFALHEIILDREGKPSDYRFLELNEAFELLTGLSRDRVIGRTVKETIPDIEDFWIEEYGKVALTGKPARFENYSSPLRKWYEIYSYSPKKNQFAVMFVDITERKQAEESLRNYTRKLEDANNDLQQFAYVTSHDLREPLRIITGFTQSLAKRYKDKLDQRANEYIDFIVNATDRMQNLIDDILAYSRVGTRGVSFEPVDMEQVLQTTLTNLKMSIEETKAEITHDPLPTVQADPNQMMQVLQNLISNAIKFRRKEEPLLIHISVRQEGGEWIFSVKDNGIGIDPELFGRLFVLFSRLHTQEEYPGTGVGLAIAKRIIQRHNGRIWVESQTGQGSTFYFSLPGKTSRVYG